MGLLRKVLILFALLTAMILPNSASGDMSGSGQVSSGASGGCYANPVTGEITCVDTSGSPVGSPTGSTGDRCPGGDCSGPSSSGFSGQSGTITVVTGPGSYSDPYGGGTYVEQIPQGWELVPASNIPQGPPIEAIGPITNVIGPSIIKQPTELGQKQPLILGSGANNPEGKVQEENTNQGAAKWSPLELIWPTRIGGKSFFQEMQDLFKPRQGSFVNTGVKG